LLHGKGEECKLKVYWGTWIRTEVTGRDDKLTQTSFRRVWAKNEWKITVVIDRLHLANKQSRWDSKWAEKQNWWIWTKYWTA